MTLRPPADPPEPMARGNVLHGFREAARNLWGERGLDEIGQLLPRDAREGTLGRGEILLPLSWFPVRWVMAWHEAIWRGPARGDEIAIARLVARSVDLGIGRIKRLLFAMASRDTFIARAPGLWRHQHTHGLLEVETTPSGAVVTLRDHPYCTNAVSRLVTTESYRYVGALASKGRAVSASHQLHAGALVVRLIYA